MSTPEFHHYQITVKDVALSRPFYRDLLGLAEIPRPTFPFPGAWFQLPHGQELHIVTVPDPLWRPPKDMEIFETHIALRVPSFREALEDCTRTAITRIFPRIIP
jgi:catechol 2,3-dioxygenase-like lactoylglutathione lyase family enzyme